jgi:hypothetical protein
MQPGSAPITDSAVSSLPRAVRKYKFYYYALLCVSGLLLLSIILYIVLWKQESDHTYLPLDSNTKLSKTMAIDSSGKMIAAVTTNGVDSTMGILVSQDGGKHFEMWGNWKLLSDERFLINKIYIAPDNKSILALSGEKFYVKAADADSFTVVTNFWPESKYTLLEGAAFSNISDSVFVFSTDSIYAFNYKRYDSIAVCYLDKLDGIVALKTAEKSNLLAGIATQNYQKGGFMNYWLSGRRVEPLSFFKNKLPDPFTEPASGVDTAYPVNYPKQAAK